jgi:hypothetical protein
VLTTRSAPTSTASLATCPFPRQCPLLELISRAIPFSFATSTSSTVMSPGCAKISTSGQLTALQLVPSITGSTIVSP